MIIILMMILVLAGCTMADNGHAGTDIPVADLPVYREEVKVTIPGTIKEENILWLSDLHIVGMSVDTPSERQEEIAQRLGYSSSKEGVNAVYQWDGYYNSKEETVSWVKILNEEPASLIIFGGDMLDYNYPEGIDLLRKGFEQLNKPYIYARADHDMLPTYLSDGDEQAAVERQNSLCKNEAVMSYAFDDFYMVVWNNSTSNLSDSGLERIKQIVAEGKPVILATHVPIQPLEDESLDKLSREVFGDRSLLWGYRDTYYYPDENTRQLLDMIYDEDSPFVEILCGHMHFSWSGMVSGTVHQTVFSAAFERYMGVIHISGE